MRTFNLSRPGRTPGAGADRGFTLIELLLTSALLVVLVAVATPAWRGTLERSRVEAARDTLQRDLTLARAEAVRQGASTTLCSGDAAAGCAAGPWSGGYIVFTDLDGDGVLDAGDTLMREEGPFTAATLVPTVTTPVQFNAAGFLIPPARTFVFCGAGGNPFHARGLIVSPSGRVRATFDSDLPTDGIHDDSAGTNLSCP